ncbi:LytR C-terminal domain-containing protein [Patescibacteria group bacterium]
MTSTHKDSEEIKNDKKKEEKSDSPSMVTQVVEVVEEDTIDSESKKTSDVHDEKEQVEDIKVESSDTEISTDKHSDTKEHGEPEIEVSVHDSESARHQDTVEDTSFSDNQDEKEKEKATVESIFSNKNEPEVMPEIAVHKTGNGSKKGLYVWAIGLIIMALTVGAGLLFFSGGSDSQLPSIIAQSSPTPTVTESPTPTPSPEPVEKDELSVQVLNGSGEAGVAGSMKSFLEDLDYSVDDTGNADEYDYVETEISVKESAESILKILEEELEEEYVIGSAKADLDDDYEYDIRVIVGAE